MDGDRPRLQTVLVRQQLLRQRMVNQRSKYESLMKLKMERESEL